MHRLKSWFRNLKVSQKLMLITVFFVMPDSLMFYFFITGMNANIRFAELEKMGNEYQRPLEQLLELIPEHRALAESAARGAAAPAGELPALQARIGLAFDALEAVDARIGADLQFTDEGLAKRHREHFRAQTVRADWEELCAQLPTLDPAACDARHLRLVAAIRAMITHAGDNSNLILDPDLDSYYVMDATLLALPATQDRLATVMARAEADLRQPTISVSERQQLAIHAALLQESDLDRIKGSLQTALNEDSNFYGASATLQARLPPALDEYVTSAEALTVLANRLASEETVGITAEEFRTAGQRARAASFKLWTVAAEELDGLLQTRIETFQFRRMKSMVVAFLALCAAIGFVTFITRSITGPLRKQAIEALRRAEWKFRNLVEQLPTITYHATLGETCTWTYVSPQILTVLGFTPEEWLASDKLWFDHVHPEDRAIPIEAEAEALRSGSFFAEYRMFTRTGELRWVRDQALFVPGADSTEHSLYGVMMDITEAKDAERREHLNKKIIDSSRQAGMAEVATGVLHNVGNVLNSVNISAGLVLEKLRASKVGGFAKASELLAAHETDLAAYLTTDEQGRRLPRYLQRLSGILVDENGALRGEVDQLCKNIEHIKEIVAMQQDYARVTGCVEDLPADTLIEDALQLNTASFARHGIGIERTFQPVPPVRVDKHKVLQILINLLRNAKHAVEDAGRPDPRIGIAVDHADDRVRIAVTDNGVGIASENLTSVFRHGFTTKKHGHGFGLHSGANAAREMGGALTATSSGPGLGATFTLELPIAKTTPNS